MWVTNRFSILNISIQINVFTLILDQRLMSTYDQYQRHNNFRFLHQMGSKCNPFQHNYYTDFKCNLCFHTYETVCKVKLFNYKTGCKYNSFIIRLTSNGCFNIIEQNIKYTVFYQKYGFPYYMFNIRVVCFRTCSDAVVPIHNYPKWVILVRHVLFR